MWLTDAWDEYLYWQSQDKKTLERINTLIKETMRHPFTGMGKPEPLKSNLSGWSSRRITREHRIVYKVENKMLVILQCRFHYDDR
jgi:toxin YoeB